MPLTYLVVALRLCEAVAPNLENLVADDTSIPTVGPVKFDHSELLNITVARTLSTVSIPVPITAKFCNPRDTTFLRLLTLTLKHSSPEECLAFLKCCPVLEDLNLHFHDIPDGAIPFNHPTIMLMQLRNFHLSHTGNSENGDSSISAGQSGEIGQLLDSLQLPRLNFFYLWTTILGSARYADPNLPWDYLSRLITRSNCSLNRLELRSPHIDMPSMLECLRLSPDLKCLGIQADEEVERNVAQILPTLDSLRIFD
ncbi:hypothetical protein BD410DRAFT_902664 [Rickenella mellea]|uniref:F-box domain-containing protein n=1 Tax=Rickenella mellea TaxID=50990 RepID=A0A4Y7PLC7_9AGAM|nr:hypothetical protein BD410DRAFT_902664 [Rickenella mellea]